MADYARVIDGEVYTVIAQEQYDALPDEYRAMHRPLEDTPAPAATPQQAVERAGFDVRADRVVRRWALRDKTAAEQEAEADEAERQALLAAAAFLDSPAPATLVAAAADIQRLKRLCKWLLRQLARPPR